MAGMGMIVADEQLGANGIADGDATDAVAGMGVSVAVWVGMFVGTDVNVEVGASVGGGGAEGANS